MDGLSFSESEVVESMVGGIVGMVGYLNFRPGAEGRLVAAVAARLDGVGMALLETLLTAAQREDG